jgi:P-type E1-E2 ATPase
LVSKENEKIIKNNTIFFFLLVPGDIIYLEEGNTIPADVRLIEASSLQIIESVLTGESEPVLKITKAIVKPNLTIGDRHNMAFMSTSVGKNYKLFFELSLFLHDIF